MEYFRNLPEQARRKYAAEIAKMIEEIREEKDEDLRQEHRMEIMKMIREIREEKKHNEPLLTEEETQLLQDALRADNEVDELLDDFVQELLKEGEHKKTKGGKGGFKKKGASKKKTRRNNKKKSTKTRSRVR